MSTQRRCPHSRDTHELYARLHIGGRAADSRRVLDLSEDEMLITGPDVGPGVVVPFELVGAGVCCRGVAAVTRRDRHAIGLRFVWWERSALAAFREFIRQRVPPKPTATTTTPATRD